MRPDSSERSSTSSPATSKRQGGSIAARRILAPILALLAITPLTSPAWGAYTTADDLPGPPAHLETIPAGSLVIPMDTTHQAVVAPFNLRAYGLVNDLLQRGIPVKWAIRAGKTKDAVDFTANAQRIAPSAIATASRSFSGGPFVVHRDFAQIARTRIAAFGQNVAVYELTADATVDVRYDLRFKPEIVVSNVNSDIHTDAYDAAGIPDYVVTAPANVVSTSCYTFVSEPHTSILAGITNVKAFVQSGGNFLAQCAASSTYENDPAGRFQTTLGITTGNVNNALEYPNPDLAFIQITGILAAAPGGSHQDWLVAAPSVFQGNTHILAGNAALSPPRYAATAAKLHNGPGGMAFYLGGHDYSATTLDEINGRRLLMNAALVPVTRPPACGFDFAGSIRGIAGTVYEDVNGDSALADAVGRPGARVRLYADGNANGVVDAGDTFLVEATTDPSGGYAFEVATLVTGNNYLVVVDSKSVTASAGLNPGATQADVWAEQTYGDDTTTVALDLGPRFGGRAAGTSDDFAASTAPASNVYQHGARVDVSSGNATGVHFAFSFHPVTHLRGGDGADDDATAARTIQGSLRQFIQNANALAGPNAMRFVPAVAADQSGGGGSWWRLPVTVALPALVDADTTIDGTAYRSSDGTTVRDENPGQMGAGGTVGVDSLALPALAKPELEIVDVRSTAVVPIGLDLQGSRSIVRGIALYGFGATASSDLHANVRVGASASGVVVENSTLGSGASGFADPGAAARSGGDNLRITGGDSGIVRNSLIGFAAGGGVVLRNASNGWLVEASEIRSNAFGRGRLDGVGLDDSSASATVRGNLLVANDGNGIDSVATGGSHTIVNNTIRDNGIGPDPDADGQPVETSGIRLFGAGSVVDRNVVTSNYGAGILVTSGAANNTLTRNSIFANGAILGRTGAAATGQVGIDLLAAANDPAKGTSPFVTANDAGDADPGGNGLRNFPLLSQAWIRAGNLVVKGFARPGDVVEVFLAAPDPRGFGEGQTWAFTAAEGGPSDSDSGTGTYGPGLVNGLAQGTDTTNRFTFTVPLPGSVVAGSTLTATATAAGANGATSEFSGNVTANPGSVISGALYHDVNGSGGSDPGEPGIGSGVWVKLVSGGSVVQVVQPDAETGSYSFDLVANGSYTVVVDDNASTADAIATQPGSWAWVNPVTGARSVTTTGTDVAGQDFGFAFAGACVCGYQDGAFALAAISIDGDMSDWAAVLADRDNVSCDAANAGDRDAVVASSGRNMSRAAITWDATFVSVYLERAGRVPGDPSFLFYVDSDNDGSVETGEPVLAARWLGGSNVVDLDLYSYQAASPSGDSLVDGSGYADGYALPGTLSPVQELSAGRSDSAGTAMEWKVAWTDLGVAAGSAFSWHAASTSAAPGAPGLPSLLDDNLGGCRGECAGSIQFGGLEVSDAEFVLPGQTAYFTHPIVNTGNGLDRFDFSYTATGDFAPAAVRYYRDNGVLGTYEPGIDTLLTDSDGDASVDTGPMVARQVLPCIVAIDAPAPPAYGVSNVTIRATSSYSAGCGSGPAAFDTVLDPVKIPAADLVVTKTDGRTSVDAGTNVAYTIVVKNDGPDAVADAPVSDTFDPAIFAVASITWACVVSGTGVCDAGSGTGNIATTVDLDAGSRATFTVTAPTRSGAVGTITNVASAAAPPDRFDPNPANNSGTDADTVIARVSDLRASKTDGTTSIAAGGTLTYTITITNLGPSDVSGAPVTDTLDPAFFDPATVTWTCSVPPGSGGCAAATGSGNVATTVDLVAGAAATFVVTAPVRGSASGTISNTASVAVPPGGSDPDPSNNSGTDGDTLVTPVIDLSLTKSVSNSTPAVGTNVVFTITVSANATYGNATGVIVTDVLPSGYAWVSDDGGGSYVPATGVWTVGAVAAGGSRSLQITARVLPSGSYTNAAEVTAANQPDANDTYGSGSGSDYATRSTAPTPRVDLSLAKTVDNATPAIGSNVVFTITVSNAAGYSNATGVVVTDLLPNGYAWVADDGAGSYVPASGVWTVGAVAAGGEPIAPDHRPRAALGELHERGRGDRRESARRQRHLRERIRKRLRHAIDRPDTTGRSLPGQDRRQRDARDRLQHRLHDHRVQRRRLQQRHRRHRHRPAPKRLRLGRGRRRRQLCPGHRRVDRRRRRGRREPIASDHRARAGLGELHEHGRGDRGESARRQRHLRQRLRNRLRHAIDRPDTTHRSLPGQDRRQRDPRDRLQHRLHDHRVQRRRLQQRHRRRRHGPAPERLRLGRGRRRRQLCPGHRRVDRRRRRGRREPIASDHRARAGLGELHERGRGDRGESARRQRHLRQRLRNRLRHAIDRPDTTGRSLPGQDRRQRDSRDRLQHRLHDHRVQRRRLQQCNRRRGHRPPPERLQLDLGRRRRQLRPGHRRVDRRRRRGRREPVAPDHRPRAALGELHECDRGDRRESARRQRHLRQRLRQRLRHAGDDAGAAGRPLAGEDRRQRDARDRLQRRVHDHRVQRRRLQQRHRRRRHRPAPERLRLGRGRRRRQLRPGHRRVDGRRRRGRREPFAPDHRPRAGLGELHQRGRGHRRESARRQRHLRQRLRNRLRHAIDRPDTADRSLAGEDRRQRDSRDRLQHRLHDHRVERCRLQQCHRRRRHGPAPERLRLGRGRRRRQLRPGHRRVDRRRRRGRREPVAPDHRPRAGLGELHERGRGHRRESARRQRHLRQRLRQRLRHAGDDAGAAGRSLPGEDRRQRDSRDRLQRRVHGHRVQRRRLQQRDRRRRHGSAARAATPGSRTTAPAATSPATGVWTVGAVAAGASQSLQITARVLASGSYTNAAEVAAANQPDANDTYGNGSGNDYATRATTPAPTVDLSLAKSVDNATPAVGGTVVFTITVSNAAGYSNATGVVVTDLLPSGFAWLSDDSAGSYLPATGVWTVGAVAAGASRSLQITARVLASGNYTNSAEVTAAALPDANDIYGNGSGNDFASATASPTGAIDLTLAKSVDNATPAVGGNVVFTITVSNAAGYSNATGVVVTDLLPNGYSWISDDGGGSYVPATGVWTVGAVAAGASQSLQITARVLPSGSYTNATEVTAANQPDANDIFGNGSGNDYATQATTPAPRVDLSLAKTVDNATPAIGSNVVFTITVSNAAGYSNATGVVVTDLLPNGYAWVADDGAGSYVPATGVWTVGAVAAGASQSLQITARVLASGSYTNAAEVTAANQPDANDTYGNGSGNDYATRSTAPTPRVDLSLAKTVDNATPAIGSNVVFTITASNAAGYSNATGVVVTDLLPSGYSWVSDDGGGSYLPATGVWAVGAVAAGGSKSLQITARVLPSGNYTNAAEVTAANQPDANDIFGNGSGNDYATRTTTPTPRVDLSLAKTVDNATPAIGSNIVFTITASNAAGYSNATGVVVTDLLPSGYSWVSDDGAGSYVPATGVWTVGAVAAGGSRSLQITARVLPSGNYTNTAEVTAANQPDANDTYGNGSGTDYATRATTPTPRVDLSLAKTVDNATPAIGSNIVFTITTSNAAGYSNATGVVVTDLLPSGYSWVSDDGGGSYAPATGVWTVGAVAAGGSRSLQITARVLPSGNYTNAAEVTAANQPDANDTYGNGSGSDFATRATSPLPAVDLSLTKTVDIATPTVGSNVVFTITVSNAAGYSNATGVVVTDLLPSGFSWLSDDGAGSYVPATGVWTVGAVAAGGSRSIQITARVLASGDYTNIAEVTAADLPDPNDIYGNGSGSDFASVTANPSGAIDLTLTKTVDDPTPAVGSNVVFTITASNAAGYSNATGVVVTDLLPSGYSWVSDDGGGSYLPATGVWAVSAVAAGGSKSLQITARVLPSGNYTNAAEVTAANQPDANDIFGNGSGNDYATRATTPTPRVDLSLAKTIDNATPAVGSNVVFTITASNAAGYSNATGVVVTDPLPSGYSWVSDDGSGSYTPATGVWAVGSVPAGGSRSLQITARVLGAGSYANAAEVTAANQPDANDSYGDGSGDDFASATSYPSRTVDLSLVKTVSDPTPAVGANVTFTISLSNAIGYSEATGVTVTDVLPSGYAWVSDDGGGDYAPATGTWVAGSVSAGASKSLQIIARVLGTGSYTNAAEVTAADQPDANDVFGNGSGDDFATRSTTPSPRVDLSLAKIVDDHGPPVGADVVFTISLSNAAGFSDATGVVVTDLLPSGFVWISDDGAGSYAPATGAWNAGSVPAGTSKSLRITARVLGSGSYTNVAEVTAANQPDANDIYGNGSGDDFASATSNPNGTVDLSLAKNVSNPTPAVGTNVTFTITVSNAAGYSDAAGVVVADALPDGYEWISDDGAGSYAPATGVWSVGSVPAGAGKSLRIIARVLGAGSYTNTAEVTAADHPDADDVFGNGSGNDFATRSTTPIPTVDLSLTKIVDDPSPAVGSNVVFTVTASNATGFSDATGVVVTDLLPSGFVWVSDDGAGSYAPATGVWTAGSVPAGGSKSLRITARVLGSGSYTNAAEVTAADQPDANDTFGDGSGNDFASATASPNGTVDLSLAKSVSNPAPAVGSNVVFTITVSNAAGYSDAAGVVVTDALPSGYAWASDDGAGSYVPATGVWTVGPVPAGGSKSLRITARVLPSGGHTNAAEVTAAAQPDANDTFGDGSGNDFATRSTTPVPTVDLSLAKIVDDPSPAVGSNVVFTVTVSNATGYSDATGVVVTDLLPGGFVWVSDDGAGSYVPATGVWTAGSVPAGSSKSLRITARVLPSGDHTNAAEVSAAAQPDANDTFGDGSGNDFATRSTTPVPTVDLSLAKIVDDPSPAVGSNVVFTVTVSNATGYSDATGVVVTDLLPGGFVWVSDDGAGSYVPATGAWTAGSVPAGGSKSLRITARVLGSGSYANVAEVTAAAQPDADDIYGNGSGNDFAGVTARPNGTVDLSLAKTVSNPAPPVGTSVIFTITVSNAGGYSDATGVVVTDVLPNGYAWVSDDGAGSYVSATGVWTAGSVAAGGSKSLRITARVLGSGSYTNAAEVTAAAQPDANDTFGNGSGNDFATRSTTPVPTVDLSLAKIVDDPSPAVGSNVVFTVTVSNATGYSDATGVVVSDSLPTGYLWISDDGAGSYAPATGTWTVGSVPAGSSRSLRITARVLASGSYTNAAEVVAAGQPDANDTYGDGAGGDSATRSTSPDPRVDLSTAKIVDRPSPEVGANVVFTITVSNAVGYSDATGVVVSDLLPSGYAWVLDDGAGSYVPATGTWTVGAIAAGGSRSLRITARVLGSGSYTNAAEVASAGQRDVNDTYGDGSGNDHASVATTPGSVIDLSMAKTVDTAEPQVGANVVFTLTVSNRGGWSLASDVVVRDSLPGGYAYVADDGGGAYDPSSGRWTVGSIAGGASATLRLTARVLRSGAYRNEAEVVSAGQPDTNDTFGDGSGNDFATATTAPRGADGTVDITDTSVPGDVLDLRVEDADLDADPSVTESVVVRVLNDATGETEIVTLLETGPDTGVFTGTLPTLLGSGAGPDNDGTMSTKIGDTVTVTYQDELTADRGSAVRTDTDVVTGIALRVAKTADREQASVGTVIGYTLRVENITASRLTDVTVSDLIPAGFKLVEDSVRLLREGSDHVPGSADDSIEQIQASGVRPIAFGPFDLAGPDPARPTGASEVVLIRYLLRVGSGAVQGDHENLATPYLSGVAAGAIARVTVRVTADPTFDLATIVGKVFEDSNENDWQDPDEPGIGGAMVALDDGTYALTDDTGRYHFPVLQPGQRMVKLNLRSLPAGSTVTGEESRILSLTPGIMARATFGVITRREVRTIGSPGEAAPGLIATPEPTPLQIVGDTETRTVRVNGAEIRLPSAGVQLRVQNLDGIVRIGESGLEGPVSFEVGIEGSRPVRRFALSILDAQGSPVRVLRGEGAPPAEISWDGKTEDGSLVRAGEVYQYRVEVEWQDGSSAAGAGRYFGVNRRSMIAVHLTSDSFLTAKAVLSEKARENLDRAAEVLRQAPDEKVLVEGHTDNVGSRSYNMDLSRRRAQAVVTYFVKDLGFPVERFVANGYGFDRPVASNATPEGRAKNRRVEIRGQTPTIEEASLPAPAPVLPRARINGSPVETSASGAFTVDGAAPTNRIDLEIDDSQGRTVRSTVRIPSLEIGEPRGEMVLAGEGGSCRRGPDEAGRASAICTLRGRTDPGNLVEIEGKPATVEADGTFRAEIAASPGRSVHRVTARSPEGLLRSASVRLEVMDRAPDGRAVVADGRVPSLTLQLPPSGVKLPSTRLALSGKTDPGNQVEVNGAPATVGSDGAFDATVDLASRRQPAQRDRPRFGRTRGNHRDPGRGSTERAVPHGLRRREVREAEGPGARRGRSARRGRRLLLRRPGRVLPQRDDRRKVPGHGCVRQRQDRVRPGVQGPRRRDRPAAADESRPGQDLPGLWGRQHDRLRRREPGEVLPGGGRRHDPRGGRELPSLAHRHGARLLPAHAVRRPIPVPLRIHDAVRRSGHPGGRLRRRGQEHARAGRDRGDRRLGLLPEPPGGGRGQRRGDARRQEQEHRPRAEPAAAAAELRLHDQVRGGPDPVPPPGVRSDREPVDRRPVLALRRRGLHRGELRGGGRRHRSERVGRTGAPADHRARGGRRDVCQGRARGRLVRASRTRCGGSGGQGAPLHRGGGRQQRHRIRRQRHPGRRDHVRREAAQRAEGGHRAEGRRGRRRGRVVRPAGAVPGSRLLQGRRAGLLRKREHPGTGNDQDRRERFAGAHRFRLPADPARPGGPHGRRPAPSVHAAPGDLRSRGDRHQLGAVEPHGRALALRRRAVRQRREGLGGPVAPAVEPGRGAVLDPDHRDARGRNRAPADPERRGEQPDVAGSRLPAVPEARPRAEGLRRDPGCRGPGGSRAGHRRDHRLPDRAARRRSGRRSDHDRSRRPLADRSLRARLLGVPVGDRRRGRTADLPARPAEAVGAGGRAQDRRERRGGQRRVRRAGQQALGGGCGNRVRPLPRPLHRLPQRGSIRERRQAAPPDVHDDPDRLQDRHGLHAPRQVPQQPDRGSGHLAARRAVRGGNRRHRVPSGRERPVQRARPAHAPVGPEAEPARRRRRRRDPPGRAFRRGNLRGLPEARVVREAGRTVAGADVLVPRGTRGLDQLAPHPARQFQHLEAHRFRRRVANPRAARERRSQQRLPRRGDVEDPEALPRGHRLQLHRLLGQRAVAERLQHRAAGSSGCRGGTERKAITSSRGPGRRAEFGSIRSGAPAPRRPGSTLDR